MRNPFRRSKTVYVLTNEDPRINNLVFDSEDEVIDHISGLCFELLGKTESHQPSWFWFDVRDMIADRELMVHVFRLRVPAKTPTSVLVLQASEETR